MIKIPNTDNKFSYNLMNIFEIAEEYHIKVAYNDNNNYDNNDDDDYSD
jgi:hypothetical protein